MVKIHFEVKARKKKEKDKSWQKVGNMPKGILNVAYIGEVFWEQQFH